MPTKLVPVIGLEIHVELKTQSKMFCACRNDPFATAPNTHVCEICLGHPGTLPAPNRAAIAATVKIARALNCTIASESKFDRKHYFYPDLPKGYQISQYDQPIGAAGFLELDLTATDNHRPRARIGITRVHLEEDTAKLTHGTAGSTLVDFNRAGVPLVEIVTEPEGESAQEAKLFCQELQLILRALGVSPADMEKGQMRCEANVSLQEEGRFEKKNGTLAPLGDYVLNNKVEVKNINSFRSVERAITFELERQAKLIAQGLPPPQENRGWDEDKQATVHQRSKETAADYRYFPEPDIPPFSPLALAGDFTLPELPAAERQRFHSEYGFSRADAAILTASRDWAAYAESVMSELSAWLHALPDTHACTITDKNADRPALCKTAQELVRLAGGWLTSKLMGALNERAKDIRTLKVKPENFAELVALVYAGRVNSTNAQKILLEMIGSGVDKDPTHIMEERGYGQITDEARIGALVEEVIKSYPAQVAQFRAGKEPLIKFLIGMAMKASEGSADPAAVEKLLRNKLTAR
ncbi:MAG: Asp-tRNA(Asn)/Glu-tRNA(Gln) amidotransferase subunit GatB [Candidatus Magasanikbacteria bacterium]|nr:Asp-tRNA(Asn)/Glu-tRNA(Gln) amidotransferase subunit GatB [Candidatus Magasanikbacteria bacterium]